MLNRKSTVIARPGSTGPTFPGPADIQTVVCARLSVRFGLPPATAALVAALAGLGVNPKLKTTP